MSSVTFCLDEFFCGRIKIVCLLSAEAGWWKTGEARGLSCSVTTVMPSGRRFKEDTWDQRTWTMSWGVTLNWNEPLFIPALSFSCCFPSISSLASYISALSGPWAYFPFTTWSIPPCYSPNLLTPYLCLSHFLSMPHSSGHRQANANIPQYGCESQSNHILNDKHPHIFSAGLKTGSKPFIRHSCIYSVAIFTQTIL